MIGWWVHPVTHSQGSHSLPITDLRQEQQNEVDNISGIVAIHQETPPGDEEQEIEKTEIDNLLPDSQPRPFQDPSLRNREITNIRPAPNIVGIGEEVKLASSGEEVHSDIDEKNRRTKVCRNNRIRLLKSSMYFQGLENLEGKTDRNSAFYSWGPARVMQDG